MYYVLNGVRTVPGKWEGGIQRRLMGSAHDVKAPFNLWLMIDKMTYTVSVIHSLCHTQSLSYTVSV